MLKDYTKNKGESQRYTPYQNKQTSNKPPAKTNKQKETSP